MKKYIFIFVCMIISMALMSGCSNTSVPGTENSFTENSLSQHGDITDWEPTVYETVNNLEGVVMTVKEGTASPAGLTVVFENNSGSQCLYGSYFGLEKKINENWYQVPVTIEGNYAFDAIGYDLASGGDSEWTIDWEWLYGNLDTGEYRIGKDILDFRGTGDYDTYYFAAEFIVPGRL